MKTILAIDLGKRNSVFCRLNTSSLKPEYFTTNHDPRHKVKRIKLKSSRFFLPYSPQNPIQAVISFVRTLIYLLRCCAPA